MIGETNLSFFKHEYFGGQRRIDTLTESFATLRKITGGKVQVLTASWAPIPEREWAKYVLHVLNFLGMGFDEAHVIAVWAPGPPKVPDKARALVAYLLQIHQGNQSMVRSEIEGAVLVGASFKYVPSVLKVGAAAMLPGTETGLQDQHLRQLILHAKGLPLRTS
jgi:hypothetical protein